MFCRIFIICIGTLILTTGIARADIRITEIAWMGTVDSQFGEWFELYNNGIDNVNLAGWKLYEDAGAQLVFTLTKTIPAGGYLLVERTTASSPDPVPGVNDESGPFGGSGFANTGEDLLLKDTQGTTIQELSFVSGWPAGDADTKETMQWNGSSWVTAVATPKASLQGGGGVDTIPQTEGSTYIPKKIGPKVELSIPKTIYATVSSEYSAKTFLEYEEVYSGVFLWNMGDGTIYKTTNPTVIKHTYSYSGSYTISFAYYRTPYDKKPELFSSIERNIITPQIVFKVLSTKGFEFTNTDSLPIDLSGWFIVLPEDRIELPPFSIIGAKKTVIMPFVAFNLSSTPSGATLETPERVGFGDKNITTEIKSSRNILKNQIETPIQLIFENTQASAATIDETPRVPKTKNNTKTFIFLGFLLIVIILFIFVERTMVKQQEE